MEEQILGNFTYFIKAQVAYAKQNYKKAKKYLDKYLVSRNQKNVSFKDDMLMGILFYCLEWKVNECINDYGIALGSYDRLLSLLKKKHEQLKHKIITVDSDCVFYGSIEKTSFEIFHDTVNDKDCLRITIPVARALLMANGFESKMFKEFGVPGYIEYFGSENDKESLGKKIYGHSYEDIDDIFKNNLAITIYDYDFRQLKKAEDSNKSDKELKEIFKRRFFDLKSYFESESWDDEVPVEYSYPPKSLFKHYDVVNKKTVDNTRQRNTIGFDLMLPELKTKVMKIPMALGKTATGKSIVIDLAESSHILIAGDVGSGKSVCINSLICSILYTKTPREVQFVLISPSMSEFSIYNDMPHLYTPVITDIEKAENFIAKEIERRYESSIHLPYLVVVIDKYSDFMAMAEEQLKTIISNIASFGKELGIYLVLATHHSSVDDIPEYIKSLCQTRIAFAVSDKTKSQVILDTTGAEKLLGKGDMLYRSSNNKLPQRIQGAYVDSEIEDIVDFVKTHTHII